MPIAKSEKFNSNRAVETERKNPHITFWEQDSAFDLHQVELLPVLDPDKPVIVFDLDGVITHPQDLKSQILSALGYSVSPEESDNHTARQKMLEQHPERKKSGVRQDYKQMIDELYVKRMSEVPPEDNAVEILRFLAATEAFNLVIVTSRKSSAEDPQVQAAGEWLKQYQLKFAVVISTSEQDKKEALSLIVPLFFVDDSLSKLAKVFENPDACTIPVSGLEKMHVFLFRQLANQQEAPRGQVGDITGGWLGVAKKISELTGNPFLNQT